MTQWNIEQTEQYGRDYKYYEKKHRNELLAVLANLQDYFKLLCDVDNPLAVTAGFIHDEPKGIKAIDQKGSRSKVKLQQTRLYVYPEEAKKTLHLLAIGDKHSQQADLKYCANEVESFRKQ